MRLTLAQAKQGWAFVAEQATQFKPEPSSKTRSRRQAAHKSERANTKLRPTGTRRLGLRVTQQVYARLSEEADARSLDISALLLLIAMGLYRLRMQDPPDNNGPRTKVVNMTITAPDLKRVHRMMRCRGTNEVDALSFAVKAAVGAIPADTNVPVLLTRKETQILAIAAQARDLAGSWHPPHQTEAELLGEFRELRQRFGSHGAQPNDERRATRLAFLIQRLEGEIMLAASEPDIHFLWQQVCNEIRRLGPSPETGK